MKKLALFFLSMFFIQCSTNEKEEYPTLSKEEQTVVMTLASGAHVVKQENHYVYLGDLILSEEQFRGLDQQGDVFAYKKQKSYEGPFKPEYGIAQKHLSLEDGRMQAGSIETKVVARPPGTHWAMVRFTFDSNLTSSQISAIQLAMDEMEAQTNVRFYNATGEPTTDPRSGVAYDYINFLSSTVNSSQVGSVGGQQTINIVSFNSSTIMHEILHALGLFHEQSRPDREEYIEVHYENVSGANAYNFDVAPQNSITMGDFDFDSIMLYDSYAFSQNGRPTITKRDGSLFERKGPMSELDKKYVNTYYLSYRSNPNGERITLDDRVYKSDNSLMTITEREILERQLNGE